MVGDDAADFVGGAGVSTAGWTGRRPGAPGTLPRAVVVVHGSRNHERAAGHFDGEIHRQVVPADAMKSRVPRVRLWMVTVTAAGSVHSRDKYQRHLEAVGHVIARTPEEAQDLAMTSTAHDHDRGFAVALPRRSSCRRPLEDLFARHQVRENGAGRPESFLAGGAVVVSDDVSHSGRATRDWGTSATVMRMTSDPHWSANFGSEGRRPLRRLRAVGGNRYA